METHSPTFDTVLCAVDLSTHSQAALYLAAGLAFSPGARLIVVLVDDRMGGDPNDAAGARTELEEFVAGTLAGAPGIRQGLELILRRGPTAPVILDLAAELDADLVVVGSHGRTAIGRALFGSTAAALLENSRVPLAIVPPTHPTILSLAETHAVPNFGMILVPVDLDTDSSRQLAFAARLSSGSLRHLLLLHVVPQGTDVHERTLQLKALAGRVESAQGWRVVVQSGTIVEEVLSVIHHESVRIVVLGQSDQEPGRLAYELVRRGNAVVIMAP